MRHAEVGHPGCQRPGLSERTWGGPQMVLLRSFDRMLMKICRRLTREKSAVTPTNPDVAKHQRLPMKAFAMVVPMLSSKAVTGPLVAMPPAVSCSMAPSISRDNSITKLRNKSLNAFTQHSTNTACNGMRVAPGVLLQLGRSCAICRFHTCAQHEDSMCMSKLQDGDLADNRVGHSRKTQV